MFLCFESNVTEFCFHVSNWQQTSIDSGNGLASGRQQAIIWTDGGLVNWHIYV